MPRITKIDDTPTAVNGLPPRRAFGRRKKYIRVAYPLIEKQNGINFWYGDQILFGKIDKQAYPVVVKEEFIKEFNSSPEYRSLNFVVDAFEALLDHIKSGFSVGVLSPVDTFLLGVRPTRAYENPLDAYQKLLSSNVEYYAGPWVDRRPTTVKNFKNFTDKFLGFAEVILQKSPVTFSEYIISDYCPYRYTGLAIEFKDYNDGDDKVKWNRILKDKNFEFFQNAARKFGFKLDYNAPWRLVADVTTKEMKEFMSNYHINSVETLFERYYEKAETKDINFLKSSMIAGYGTLISRNPLIKVPKALRINTNVKSQHITEFSETRICKIRRKPLLAGEVPGDKFWLEFYFRVRIKEERIDWHPHLLKNKIKYLKRLYDLFDFDRAMRYIDYQIFKNARG